MKKVLKGIGYKIVGEGEPVFFIHGGPGMTSKYFEFFADEFSASGYQCFLIDQLGNGMSDCSDLDSLSFERLISDFEMIRKHHGFDKINIIGHSFGGYIGLKYLLANNDSINKAVIISSIPITIDLFNLTQTKRMEFLEKESVELEEIPENIPLGYYKFFRMCYPDKTLFYKRFLELFDNSMDLGKVENIGGILMPIYLGTLPLDLSNIGNSVLILHGEKDWIPVDSGKYIAKHIQNSIFKEIDGAGHFPIDDQRHKVSEIINEFLKAGQ